MPFQGDADQEPNTGKQTREVNTGEDNRYHCILRSCHLDDHAAEVGHESVDDVDRSGVVASRLQVGVDKRL